MIDVLAPGKRRERSAEARDDAELSEIFREHFDFVWRLAQSLGATAFEVDDVVQEVFLVVRRRQRDFEPGRSVRAWLVGITRRVLMRMRRTQSRRRRRELVAVPPAGPPSPDDAVAREQAAALVERFLDRLDPDKRLAFVLIHIEGFTAAEAAAAADANMRTMVSRAREAHRRFDRYLQTLERRAEGRP